MIPVQGAAKTITSSSTSGCFKYDPLAPAELIEAFQEELVRHLRWRARSLSAPDDNDILDAANDALLTYAQEPTTFDPTKFGLITYLTRSAYGDLLNSLAKERRRKRRE